MLVSRKAAAGGIAIAALVGGMATQTGHTQAASARTVVEAAAKMLGGVERLRAVRNISLHGYGQYAYQMGGGRISGSPDAPEKYMAANELSRVYDVENGRFQLRERRNMLFPFLAPFGHSFALNDNRLDGDIAFDVNGDRAQRVPEFMDNPLILDGVHMRRMWMMNNPIVLVRAMLDPATRLSAPRQTGGVTVIDVTLQARRQAGRGVHEWQRARVGAVGAPPDQPRTGDADDLLQRLVRDRRSADAACLPDPDGLEEHRLLQALRRCV